VRALKGMLWGLDSPESPPVVASVPLNWAGRPIHEYDMTTEFLGGCQLDRNQGRSGVVGEEGWMSGRA
jgi:hypothetical protein